MIILGIETSCDETAAAVVKDGTVLLSNVIATSIDLHKKYGGVVPEIAARSHIESINPVIEEAIEQSGLGWTDIDAIAVTQGPGLLGSLLIGVLTARTLAIVKDKPLYAINHVEAHTYANFITKTDLPNFKLPDQEIKFPCLALIVSGGHTQIVLFKDHFDYQIIGQTSDDAVGEAFDKVARILGLPYPGGPSVAEAAKSGNPHAYKLPTAKFDKPIIIMDKDEIHGSAEAHSKTYMKYGEASTGGDDKAIRLKEQQVDGSAIQQVAPIHGDYRFSFSGLKTAVLRAAQSAVGKTFELPSHELPELLNEAQKNDLAASFQYTAVATLANALTKACQEFSPATVVIAGGVAANQELRKQLDEQLPIKPIYTDMKLCTDNAAMIASLGYFKAINNQPTADPYTLQPEPNLSM